MCCFPSKAKSTSPNVNDLLLNLIFLVDSLQSKVSHLRQLVAAGTKALPDLVKMERLRQGSVSALNSEGTLPGLLELGPEFAIRSTFNCPVDKTQANAGNPPVALPCGHLIGKVSSIIIIQGSKDKYLAANF